MVRQVNYSTEASSRAATTISATVYERKALDCTSSLPLIVSLNNLAYLVANNRKIRDLLCLDGGLERLIQILREVPKSHAVFGRPQSTKDMQPMWKWTTAFQCIVHLCIRGGVNVRERAVEAGIVPILVKVLESYLCFSDAQRAERKRISEERRLQRESTETEEERQQRQQRARERDRDRREWERQALVIAAATANLTTRRETTAAETTEARRLAAAANPAPRRPAAIVEPPAQPMNAPVNNNQTQTTRTTTLAPSPAVAGPSRPRPAQPAPAEVSAPSGTHASSSQLTLLPAPNRQLSQSSASSGSSNTQEAEPSVAVASNVSLPAISALDSASFPASGQPASVSASPDSHPNQLQATASAEDLGTAAGWSSGEAAEDADMSADGEDSEADVSSAEAARTAVAVPSAPSSSRHQQPRNDDNDERRTPRASRSNLAPLAGAEPLPSQPAMDSLRADATPQATSMGNRSETVTPRESSRHHPHHDQQPSQSQHDRSRHSSSAHRSRPVLPTTYIAETFDPSDMAFREEEVLLSLQILAYLTKYSHIRALLRFPDMTRASNLQDLDDLWDKAQTSPGTPLWQPGQQFHRSIYTIAERYTCRATRRDPSAEFIAGTTKLAPLIQYWAGVVMRNACRKDDRTDDPHAGLRQCGNMLCGKWETEPREFAKCRRCKKAKFCSKICQSTSWQIGHKYWCSSISEDSESTRSRSQREEAQQQQQQHNPQQLEGLVNADDAAPQADDEVTDERGLTTPIAETHDHEGQRHPHAFRRNTVRQGLQPIQTGREQQQNQPHPAEEDVDMETPLAQPVRGTGRRPSMRRPTGAHHGGLPGRLVSEAASAAASDVSEDEGDRSGRAMPASDYELSENEEGRGGMQGPSGLRGPPPAPMRTDLAGRPLPPPVIAGSGMDLATAQGMNGSDGLGPLDDGFGGQFRPEGVDNQFERGEIDQITWRGQTPTPQDDHSAARPYYIDEASSSRSDLGDGPSRSDDGPSQASGFHHQRASHLTAQAMNQRPSSSSGGQPSHDLRAPHLQQARRMSSMAYGLNNAGEGSPQMEATTSVRQPSAGSSQGGPSQVAPRRAASGHLDASFDANAPTTRRQEAYGVPSQMNQHQHLLMRGGITAGLMGRSATPSGLSSNNRETGHPHAPVRPSSVASTSASHTIDSSLMPLSMHSSTGPSMSSRSSPTAMTSGSLLSPPGSGQMTDDQVTPHFERRNPLDAFRGESAATMTSVSTVTTSRFGQASPVRREPSPTSSSQMDEDD